MNKEQLTQELTAKLDAAVKWKLIKSLPYKSCKTRKGEEEQAGTLTSGAVIRILPLSVSGISDDGATVFINATGVYGERYASLAVPAQNIEDYLEPLVSEAEGWAGNDT